MLRIHMCSSADGAKRYHRVSMGRGEYYLDETVLKQEQVGIWHGKAAERLGLWGHVDEEAFHRLCDNLHPLGGDRLTARTKNSRRVGYDINFHLPKSVSVMLNIGGDERITNAFRDAVRRTMAEMEGEIATRVRKDLADTTRRTGNMVWAEFVHHTARPVEGIPDPHLHAHCFAFNATYDETEEQWKAADFGPLKLDAPYFQEVYHAYLKGNLADLGYTIERSRDGWEIEGVPREVTKAFSRRTELIERYAREHGITDADEKNGLGAKTRESKLAVGNMEELRRAWLQRVTDAQREDLHRTLDDCQRKLGGSRLNRAAELAEVLDSAIAHVFERRSTVPDRELIAAALARTEGGVSPEAMRVYIEEGIAGGTLLRGSYEGVSLLTTPAVHAEEQVLLRAVKDGRGQYLPLKEDHVFRNEKLSEEQRCAVRATLESRHGVMIIRGKAGVGKTWLMDEVVHAIKSAGYTIQPVAPTNRAVDKVLKEEEGHTNAVTVARFLKDEQLRRKVRGQVLWVDEAGLMGIRDMSQLVKLARVSGARLILTGDTAQHHAVQRGDPLKLMETEACIKPAEVTQIRRQTHAAYREACQMLSDGKIEQGFERLDAMGSIAEIGGDMDVRERADALAKVYTDAVAKNQETLVVSPTHKEGDRVTEAIRERLRSEKKLGVREQSYAGLQKLDLSDSQKQDPTQYKKGDVIQFHQHTKLGLRKGGRAEVVSASKEGVLVRRSRDGFVVPLPTQQPERFSVFQRQNLGLAKGDKVRITLGGRTKDRKHTLTNGSIYTFQGFTVDGDLRLDNGWVVGREFGHVQHGYCVTSHTAQGRGVKHVIIAQSAESSGASNMQQFYTSVTRGKSRVTIVTDDKKRLLNTVVRDASRVSATRAVKSDLAPMLPPIERASTAEYRRQVGRWLQQRRAQALGREARAMAERTPMQIEQHRQRLRQSRSTSRGRREGINRGRDIA